MNNQFNDLVSKVKQQCESRAFAVYLTLDQMKLNRSKKYWDSIYINTLMTKKDVIKAYQKGIDEYKLTRNK